MDQLNSVKKKVLEKQKEICKKYSADFLSSPVEKMIGLALNGFNSGIMPINENPRPDTTRN